MIRVFTYARFSTDLQNDKSNADQQSDHRRYVASQVGWMITREFADDAVSGSSVMRRDFHAMMRAALAGECDVVLAESLDRFSRDLEHVARFYKQLHHVGVHIFTVNYGEITPMHVGLLGTMSTLFLKDLGEKTSRGLRGLVERGKMAGGLSYAYRVASRGEWAIVPEQANVVLRIMRLYADGVSPVAIAKRLNAEGIPGPDHCAWSPSTIHGHVGRGTGILNNELYVGVYVWPKQRFLKDPNTGKRVARPVADERRGRYPRPHLRLAGLTDNLWEQVKRRQAATRRAMIISRVRGRRPVFLFSGLAKCAVCGGGYNLYGRDELRCFNKTKRATCSNPRMIKRQELEVRVLRAIQDRFLADSEAFAAFCEGFTEELNHLRRESRAKLAAAPRELAANKRRALEILNFMTQGYVNQEWKDELRRLDVRRVELEAMIASAEAEPAPPALHPHMATVYREKVEHLATALAHEDEDQRAAAREAVRGFITSIVIPPGDGLLEVRGDLGRMLAAAAGEHDGSALAAVAYDGCGGGI